jgi:hypothetical protein
MALRKTLILRKPRSGCLEGRTAPVQPFVNCCTCSFAGQIGMGRLRLRGSGLDHYRPAAARSRFKSSSRASASSSAMSAGQP